MYNKYGEPLKTLWNLYKSFSSLIDIEFVNEKAVHVKIPKKILNWFLQQLFSGHWFSSWVWGKNKVEDIFVPGLDFCEREYWVDFLCVCTQ